jgi:UDP-N-acetylglucosamine diphosphorylase/glucosamine-1-phosphate N-acetyltransferase
MNYILFDSSRRKALLPFAFTKPVAEFRIGILTIREKWEKYLGSKTSTLTEDYLSVKYPVKTDVNNVLINSSVLPNPELVEQILNLKEGETLTKNDSIIAMRLNNDDIEMTGEFSSDEDIVTDVDFIEINNNWDIYNLNHKAIIDDFNLVTEGRKSQPLSDTNFVIGDKELIFLEEGAKVEYAFLNTTEGPIYIGKNAEIMEGAKVRGPFSLGDNSVVKMDAKIYTGTTIGPWCKVGGEINNSVFFGYSNKAHDGFMGQSVIGEWCNLGADTNISNLKNTYDPVKLWSYSEETFINTGLQFCGLMMGDHSKCGINTMFNTGTVVGVSCNIFGAGYQRNFIPSFSWGGATKGFKQFVLKKAFQASAAMMKRRGIELSEEDKIILSHVFEETFNNRLNL